MSGKHIIMTHCVKIVSKFMTRFDIMSKFCDTMSGCVNTNDTILTLNVKNILGR